MKNLTTKELSSVTGGSDTDVLLIMYEPSIPIVVDNGNGEK